MTSKNKILKIIFCAILFYLFMVGGTKVKAAPLSISVSKSSATVGESIKVTITSEYTGRVNLSASGGELSASEVWVEKNSQTVTLTSQSAGAITITAKAAEGTLANGSGVDVQVASQGAKVTFTSKPTPNENNDATSGESNEKSNNANLKNLGIKPNDFKGFKYGKTVYDVTVPEDVSQVNVYATPQDSKATVSGTGDKNLNVGANVLQVVVTAEDGTKKTYTINVTRGKAQTDPEENTQDPEQTTQGEDPTNNVDENTISNEQINSDLVGLTIEGYTLKPAFSPNIYEYSLDLISTDITKLDVVAKRNE